MKKLTQLFNTRPAQHIYFWAVVFIIMTFNHMNIAVSSYDLIIRSLISLGLMIITVYIHFFLFEHFFSQKHYFYYAVSLIFVVGFYVVVKNLFSILFFNREWNILGSIYFICIYIIITTALKIGKQGYEQRLVLKEIKAQQVQIELALLKSQINPHFLFNTLNNLFGRVRKIDEATADGIMQLSHLMRYMIYESNTETIELEKEVQQIHRLIELHKLRFLESDTISIDFEIQGDMNTVFIPPMLLIPFVENAFKHGIRLTKMSFIHIRLIIKDKMLKFLVKNSIHQQEKEVEPGGQGLGLQNVKRRLDLLFPSVYNLDVRETEKEFEVILTINR